MPILRRKLHQQGLSENQDDGQTKDQAMQELPQEIHTEEPEAYPTNGKEGCRDWGQAG